MSASSPGRAGESLAAATAIGGSARNPDAAHPSLPRAASARPSILFLSVAGGYGGSEKTMELVAPELLRLADLGFAAQNRVHLAMLQPMRGELRLGIHRYPDGRRPWHVAAGTWNTIRLAWRLRPDALVANSNKAALLLALALPFLPRSIRLSVFIRDFQWERAAWILRRLTARAKILAPSQAVGKLWPPRYGALPKLTIVPDAAPVPRHQIAPAQGKTVLLMAAVSRLKGIHVLIQAMDLVLREHPDATLRVVGATADEAYAAELRALVTQLGLGHAVSFEGHVADISRVFEDCACLVSATLPEFGGPETFGRTIIEAWAHRRPVVATSCGGPAHIIDDGINGLLVPPGDATAMAGALSRLLHDPEVARVMALAGERTFRASFTSVQVAERMFEEFLG